MYLKIIYIITFFIENSLDMYYIKSLVIIFREEFFTAVVDIMFCMCFYLIPIIQCITALKSAWTQFKSSHIMGIIQLPLQLSVFKTVLTSS